MSRKTHWSRKPEQIARNAEFLRKAGLSFEETPSGFRRMRPAELKDKLVDRLMEGEFNGVNQPKHKLAQKIWLENIEELRGA